MDSACEDSDTGQSAAKAVAAPKIEPPGGADGDRSPDEMADKLDRLLYIMLTYIKVFLFFLCAASL